MKKQHIQQGDVILRRITKLPDNCKIISDARGAVFAEGEHTGHYHGAAGVEILEAPDKRRFARNPNSFAVEIRHQEHRPVVLDPGAIYEFGQVVEKDWFSEMVRKVID